MIPFAEYSERVEHHIQSTYGIRVVTRDIPEPLTGDLNGSEIHIDHAVTPTAPVPAGTPIWAHGAMERDARCVRARRSAPAAREEELPALMEYERECARYALGLFHEIAH